MLENKGGDFMKKVLSVILFLSLLLTSTYNVFACGGSGHHGGNALESKVWHKGTDNYVGHYSNKCSEYDHVWHNSTDDYKGHYAYACLDYDHDYDHTNCYNDYHH